MKKNILNEIVSLVENALSQSPVIYDSKDWTVTKVLDQETAIVLGKGTKFYLVEDFLESMFSNDIGFYIVSKDNSLKIEAIIQRNENNSIDAVVYGNELGSQLDESEVAEILGDEVEEIAKKIIDEAQKEKMTLLGKVNFGKASQDDIRDAFELVNDNNTVNAKVILKSIAANSNTPSDVLTQLEEMGLYTFEN